MEPFTGVLIMVACLGFEAFFSGSEIGIVSADRAKLLHQAENGSRGARLALKMLQRPEWLLSTTLVGTNIAIVTNTTVATMVVVDAFGSRYGWLAAVIVAPLSWVFGEIVAKSAFQQNADSLTPKVIGAINVASYVFYPILVAFAFLTKLLARVAGTTEANPYTIREEITALMQMHDQSGDVDVEEQEMIRRVFDFGETSVAEVLVPLIDVVGIPATASCGQAIQAAKQTNHRRLPVYKDRVDQIVGVLDTLVLLTVGLDDPIDNYITEVPFIPASQSIEQLLYSMRKSMASVAIVVDEYGGAHGIVSMEDILEEVVGEIDDEHDASEIHPFIKKMGARALRVNARIGIDELARETEVDLPAGSYETLGGFLTDLSQEIPQQGSVLRFRTFSFTIEQVSEQAIQRVLVKW